MVTSFIMETDWFYSLISIVSFIAGFVASISGFGIGSFLTPVISLKIGIKSAIALVAIPHFMGTLLRMWVLRKYIHKKIFIQFGIASILGGLMGAILYSQTTNPALAITFGLVLILASIMELSGANQKIQLGKKAALSAGLASGFLGGLVGNQGGIRSAALLNFPLSQKSFVATATAIGLVIDCIRLPIYFYAEWTVIHDQWNFILISVLAVLLGTLLGIVTLAKIPQRRFKMIVALLIGLLGIMITVQAVL